MHPKASRRDADRRSCAKAAPASIATWLKEVFLPAWLDRAVAEGLPGYVECIAPDGAAAPSGKRSTMVTARLIYTFSLGHSLEEGGASLRAAEHGLRFLLDDCRSSDGRFAHGVDEKGNPSPQQADLYDLAFVLLALGGYSAATGGREALAIAAEIGSYLDTLHDVANGGYREPGEPSDRRQQFPNMHLFEACQLLSRLSPDGGWQERAEALLDLAERRLVGADGSIAEWYRSDWQRLVDGPGSEREIGHQFEWAWLLYRHAEMTGSARAAQLADRLYDFGLGASSIDEHATVGLLLNAVDPAGASLDDRRPLWPLTELLRASIAAEALDRPGRARVITDQALEAIFTHYVDAQTGLWANELDSSGVPLDPNSPTRLLYHLLPAFVAYAQAREPVFVEDNPILDRPMAVWLER